MVRKTFLPSTLPFLHEVMKKVPYSSITGELWRTNPCPSGTGDENIALDTPAGKQNDPT
jgi:hypothetical protein